MYIWYSDMIASHSKARRGKVKLGTDVAGDQLFGIFRSSPRTVHLAYTTAVITMMTFGGEMDRWS